ncbi:MAG: hypoxanthine phosphoribosyltransferase [Christensenellales bacterium]|jgi:hypoxanthine phosphoribosyltransferase
MENLHPDIERVLYSQGDIARKVELLGRIISQDYADKELLLVGVLKGAVMFYADLIRQITLPVRMDFIQASSYGTSMNSSGTIRLIKDLDTDIHGMHVLVVEDILDTGETIYHLKQIFAQRNPESVRICALFDKPSRRQAPITADYIGYEIPDVFIVGYGLDFAEKYRNLPYVGILKKRVYEN